MHGHVIIMSSVARRVVVKIVKSGALMCLRALRYTVMIIIVICLPLSRGGETVFAIFIQIPMQWCFQRSHWFIESHV